MIRSHNYTISNRMKVFKFLQNVLKLTLNNIKKTIRSVLS
ncbi:hypothetical protein LCGC14_2221540 [marine sediment metagenome]|uniref:Uncharacterized protein n=1 Tax=marine sediment metagenome TaxID=412755 RepID=A0A0F9G6B7_9ZZZZ